MMNMSMNMKRGTIGQFLHIYLKNHLSRYQFSSYQIRSPLDLSLFKNNDDENLMRIRKSLESRFRDPGLASQVSEQLEQYRTNLYNLEQTNKQINLLQKQIKERIKESKKKGGDHQKQEEKELMKRVSEEKEKKKTMQGEAKELVKGIEEGIFRIGNVVADGVPVSKNEADNQVIQEFQGIASVQSSGVPTYSEIMEDFQLTDLKRGQKVGGHRGYFLTGDGVRLALSLVFYAIDFLQKHGYKLHQSPAIITEETLKASCQLQSLEEDVYRLENSQSYLIATSEQSLAGFYRNEVLKKSEMPMRMAGYSTCFRKEAGAHGKDIHGLFRVHQFQKVEQFSIVEPKNSFEEMKKMMEVSVEFYRSLGLSFRVVNIVSGELNDAAAQKYDLEAWYPAQQRFRELVSVSNCTDYQSRQLKVQFMGDRNELIYPHMLNGTLVAVQRTMTCLVQNFYKGTHIQIPKILQNYMGKQKIIRNKK